MHDGSEKVTGGLNKLVSKSGELKQEQRIYQMVWNNWLGTKPIRGSFSKIEKGLQDLNSKVKSSAAGLEEIQSKGPSILNTVNEKIDGAGANVNQLNELTINSRRCQKCSKEVIYKSKLKVYRKNIKTVTTIHNKCCKKYSDSSAKAAGVAGGTNKLNEEVKQLKAK